MSKIKDKFDHEIEMISHGMTVLNSIPRPRCEYKVKRFTLTKDLGETCRRYAAYRHNGEKAYCKEHAEKVAIDIE